MPADIFAVNTNLLLESYAGPAIMFTAPYGTTFPTKLEDVVQVSGGATQWNPVGNWATLGATKSGIRVDRAFGKIDLQSDQSNGPFSHRPNNFTHSVSTDLLRLNPAGLRVAWEGAPVQTTFAGTRGVISGSVAVGATSLTTNASFTTSSGDTIIVGSNYSQEWHGAAAGSTTTVSLLSGESFAYAHVSGETVIKPARFSTGYGHLRANTPRLLAVIAPLIGLSGADLGMIEGMRLYAFRYTLLGEGNRSMQHSPDSQWSLPVTFHAYRDTSATYGTTDQLQDTYVVYDVVAP